MCNGKFGWLASMFGINSARSANMQDLMKFLAMVCMMIDHYGLYLDQSEIYRVVGRFSLPVFAFYVGYNFHGRIRHIIWIMGAIILALNIYVLGYFMTNILPTLALCQLYLVYAGKAILASEMVFFRHFVGMLVLVPLTMSVTDYGTLAVAWAMIGYKMKHEGKRDIDGYILLAAVALMIFNEYGMSQMYNNLWYAIAYALLVGFVAILLRCLNHGKIISINITSITRNMLQIYFVSILYFLWAIYGRIYS